MSRSFLGLLIAATLAWASPARPCTCDSQGWFETVPADGATDVPRNALVWTTAHAGVVETHVVDTTTGELVPGAWSSLWVRSHEIRVFHPERLWAADTPYEVVGYRLPYDELVERVGEAGLEDFVQLRVRFTTGAHELEDALDGPPHVVADGVRIED